MRSSDGIRLGGRLALLGLLGLLGALSGAPLARGGQAAFSGKVTEVTVFTTGVARVTRVGPLNLQAGETLVRSQPLPAQADPQSVQATLAGAAGLELRSVETRRELAGEKEFEGLSAEHQKALRAQEDAVFKVNQERQALDDAAQTAQETLRFLDRLRSETAQLAAREMAIQRLDVESWQKALELAETRAASAREKLRELVAQRREVQRRVEEEQRKYYELQRKGPQQVYQTRVYLVVQAAAAARATLSLSYNVGGADWQPAYRLSADLKAKAVTLDVYGMISQSSGEDWPAVQLSFSTARPDLGCNAPVLMPWYIRTGALPVNAEPGERNSWGAPPLASPASSAPAEAVPGVATVFNAQAPATIPSDGQSHRIAVASLSSPVTLEHVAIPKVLPHAFLQARMTNRAAFPLLPGVIEVLVGESYVGRGLMRLTAPGEPIALGLGVDEQVKVAQRLIEDKGARKRSGNKVAVTNVFQIQVQNYRAEEIQLTVIDQLPISRDARVSVSYGSEAKHALRGGEFPGQLKWELKLAPQAKQTLEFNYTLEYPEEMRQELIVGNATNYQEYQFEQVEEEMPQGKGGNRRYNPRQGAGQAKPSIAF